MESLRELLLRYPDLRLKIDRQDQMQGLQAFEARLWLQSFANDSDKRLDWNATLASENAELRSKIQRQANGKPYLSDSQFIDSHKPFQKSLKRIYWILETGNHVDLTYLDRSTVNSFLLKGSAIATKSRWSRGLGVIQEFHAFQELRGVFF